MATEIGPLQLYVINFEEPKFKGRIAEELETLRRRGEVRIVDSLAVLKDAEGQLLTGRWSDLEETEGIPAGLILAGLLGLEMSGESSVDPAGVVHAVSGMDPQEGDVASMQAMFEDVPRGGAVIVLLLEHRWALPLSRAVRDAGGVLAGQEMIDEETMARVPALLADAADAAQPGAQA